LEARLFEPAKKSDQKAAAQTTAHGFFSSARNGAASVTYTINVRVTSKARCKEGYYLIINGERVRCGSRTAALQCVEAWLKLQRVQICTVREYAERNGKKISARMPTEEKPCK
jgi:hypothetical protein